ncbi:hypothetical protein SLE2022_310620 [Rubroshorea leprosula]
MNHKDGKSGWGSAIKMEKRKLFEQKAETILLIIKQRFPGVPQSALDISKIQFNRDVGQAVLESYSRILESLAYTVLSRIVDVLYADIVAQNPSQASCTRNPLKDGTTIMVLLSNEGESATDNSMTLSDLLIWSFDQGENEKKKESTEEVTKEDEGKHLHKLNISHNKKSYYLDSLSGSRSPTLRH